MAKSIKFPIQLPSISRIITEKKPVNGLVIILAFISIVVLVLAIVIVSVNFSQNFIKFRTVFAERQNLYGKINFWKSISEKYPGYSDAYFNISILYFKLSDYPNSRLYLNKTLVFNPGYKDSEKLDVLLKSKGY